MPTIMASIAAQKVQAQNIVCTDCGLRSPITVEGSKACSFASVFALGWPTGMYSVTWS